MPVRSLLARLELAAGSPCPRWRAPPARRARRGSPADEAALGHHRRRLVDQRLRERLRQLGHPASSSGPTRVPSSPPLPACASGASAAQSFGSRSSERPSAFRSRGLPDAERQPRAQPLDVGDLLERLAPGPRARRPSREQRLHRVEPGLDRRPLGQRRRRASAPACAPPARWRCGRARPSSEPCRPPVLAGCATARGWPARPRRCTSAPPRCWRLSRSTCGGRLFCVSFR